MLFVVFPLLLLIFYLSFCLFSLITVCLAVFLLGFILPGTLCASWTWLTISFPMFRKCSAIISSNIFSGPFSLSLFSFWDPYNMNVGAFNVVQEDSQAVFISFDFSPYLLFCGIDFHHSVLQDIYLFFCLSYSALDSFQCIIHFYLFFCSSRSLVNISHIFLIFSSILFQRSQIIFTIIIPNSFSGRLPISNPFSCFSGILSCP